MSRSLRSERVEQNVILLTGESTVPSDYTHVTALNCRFPRGVASCVCPGCNSGAANHTHTSASHSHATTPTTVAPHSHTGPTGPSSAGGNAGGPVTFRIRYSHPHGVTSGTHPGTAVFTSGTDAGHTHDAFDNNPSFKTARYIKHTATSVALRKKNAPSLSMIIWPKSATPPNGFIADTRFDTFFPRGSTTVLTTGGSNTHTHASGGGVSHNTTTASHPHPTASISFAPGGPVQTNNPSGTPNALAGILTPVAPGPGHDHPVSTIAFGSCPTGSGTTSPTEGGHTHDDHNHEAANFVSRMAQSVINMRVVGIPNGGITMWEESLATIPTGKQLADGTNSTSDLRSRIPKFETSGFGAGGADTHTHTTCGSAHTHVSHSVAHTHPKTGTTGNATNYCPASSFPTPIPGTGTGLVVHTHSTSGESNSVSTSTSLDSAGSHDHGSVTSIPDSYDVALIERLA